jgi:DNA-binding XRE family transcriptional regulator
LFRNLEAEQARMRLTDQEVAEKLGISRVSYVNKKKTGKFTTLEIKALCKLFKCKFDYLFAEENEEQGA